MKYVNALEDFLIMLLIAAMGGVLALQVAMRYVFNHPLIWSEEMARYLFVWLTFIGASYGVRHGVHINMSLLFDQFPRPVKTIVQLAVNLAAAAVFASLIPSGLRFMEDQSFITSSAMQIPMSWIFAAVPVGCALVAIRLVIESVMMFAKGGAEQ